jgi:FkbM family methyltransferase
MSIARLKMSVAWKIFPWAKFSLKLSSGVRLCLQNRADFPILQEILMEQSYTPFIRELPEIRSWVDLGCNCGLFSLFLEDWARTNSWAGPRQARLIDANRYALNSARASIEKNALNENFKILEGLVGSRTGTMNFFESKSTYKSSVFELATREKRRQVPVIDLSSLNASLGGPPDLIKADIEGAEKLLFENWPEWIQTAKYLLVEWHEPHMKGRDLDAICTRLGFKLAIARPPDYLKAETKPALDLQIGSGLWANTRLTS